MTPRSWDEGGNQTNQIVVHVARIAKSCGTGAHDCRN